MKKFTYILLPLLFSGLLFATSASAELKVGFVSATLLLDKAPQAEVARKKLEREFAKRKKKLLQDQKKIKKSEDKLRRDAAIMSEAQRRNAAREIRNSTREIRRAMDELREDQTIRSNDEMVKFQKLIAEAIQAVGKTEKYDLIMYEDVVAYAHDKINITNKVLQYLKNHGKKSSGKK